MVNPPVLPTIRGPFVVGSDALAFEGGLEVDESRNPILFLVSGHSRSAEKSGRVVFLPEESFLSEGGQIGSIPVNPTLLPR